MQLLGMGTEQAASSSLPLKSCCPPAPTADTLPSSPHRQAFFVPELAAEKRRRKLHARRQERSMRRSMRRNASGASAWGRNDSGVMSERSVTFAESEAGAAPQSESEAEAGPSSAPAPPPSQHEPSVHGGVAAHLARLHSAGAASEASVGASSAAGSAADAVLLRQRSHQSQQSQQSSAEGGARPQRRLRRWGKRLKLWLLRYPVKIMFGYDPAQQGTWLPPHGYDVRCACEEWQGLRRHHLLRAPAQR